MHYKNPRRSAFRFPAKFAVSHALNLAELYEITPQRHQTCFRTFRLQHSLDESLSAKSHNGDPIWLRRQGFHPRDHCGTSLRNPAKPIDCDTKG
ncbi:hypothetical protein VI817_002712 [Penicillium citrinum]|nr:hypothetical protein VI817_002712 [Penicillium citrinum]